MPQQLFVRRLGWRRSPAAILYTLIQTATLNGLDPEAYLRDVLARMLWHSVDLQLLPGLFASVRRRSEG